MVPIRTLDPVGAIGNYWAHHRSRPSRELELLQALADSTAVAIENVRVYEQLEAARIETLHCLALAAEYRDDATHRAHRARRPTSRPARRASSGCDAREVELIRHAAPLHDIGKLAVADSLLLKAGKLSPTSSSRSRPTPRPGPRSSPARTSEVLRLGREIARTHHEWWDGSGYPAGLAGEAIPLCGRIVALADVFDALTHARPYKPAWPLDRALAEIAA